MTPLERRGLRNLTAPDYEPGPLSKWVVRIYYRSAGGEVLCCDSRPLSWQAADKLVNQHRCGGLVGWKSECKGPIASDAIDAEKINLYEMGTEATMPKFGARRVVLPSQVPGPLGVQKGDVVPCENEET